MLWIALERTVYALASGASVLDARVSTDTATSGLKRSATGFSNALVPSAMTTKAFVRLSACLK